MSFELRFQGTIVQYPFPKIRLNLDFLLNPNHSPAIWRTNAPREEQVHPSIYGTSDPKREGDFWWIYTLHHDIHHHFAPPNVGEDCWVIFWQESQIWIDVVVFPFPKVGNVGSTPPRANEGLGGWDFPTNFFKASPIPSMGLVDFPTFTIKINQM